MFLPAYCAFRTRMLWKYCFAWPVIAVIANRKERRLAFLVTAAVILGGVLATNFGIERCQAAQMRERAARIVELQYLALNGLRGDIRSLADPGDTKYELTTYLENVDDRPIYVMAPDMHAYVQGRIELAGGPAHANRRHRRRSRARKSIAISSTPAFATARSCFRTTCTCGSADHFGPALDLAVDAFERIGRAQLGPVWGRTSRRSETFQA